MGAKKMLRDDLLVVASWRRYVVVSPGREMITTSGCGPMHGCRCSGKLGPWRPNETRI
jgi:hypothetical protein